MPGEAREKKQVCLMGAPQVRKWGKPDGAPQPISDEADAMQLLALLILARDFLPSEGVHHEGCGAIRREWLLTKLYPELFAAEPQRARDKMAYALGKLEDALKIRADKSGMKRERNVVGITLDHLSIDAREITAAAKQLHVPANQEKIIALAERPLLDGMDYPWLQETVFQKARATMDGHFLTALARKADSLIVQMETAKSQGKLEDAGVCRCAAMALLDKAADRQRGGGGQQPLLPKFADLRCRAAHPLPPPGHNIPRPVTSFIGRSAEKAKIKALLTSDRLVTLTGMGGCGKTRLALTVAAELVDEGGSEIWLVELAGLGDAALVPQAVAKALGVAEQEKQTHTQALIARFGQAPALLLLDNCEHLLDACAELAETLMQACPPLKILATSRQRLNIDGECLCPVPTLGFPLAKEITAALPDPVAALLGHEAACLFLDRVRSHRDFPLEPAHVASVAAICESLDGIPLALELAAARVRTLPVEQVAEMLADRFAFLTEGRSRALPRHKTLRAVIDWSYEPLSETEKALLCRLSVFAGGWTLDAAASVGVTEDSPTSDILDLLTSLVDKSLLIADLVAGPGRYRLLETVRQYAHDRLRERGEWDETRRRHRAHYLCLAEEAAPKLKESHPKPWLDRLETEIGNLRVALEWRTDEKSLRLACALQRFWQMRGYFREGRQWLERDTQEEDSAKAVRARAKADAGVLANLQGEFQQAHRLYEVSLALWTKLGDKRGMADALCGLGDTAIFQGAYAEAEEKYGESLPLFSELEDKAGLADVLYGLGKVAFNQGRYSQAHEKFQASLILRRESGDTLKITESLMTLGRLAIYQGRHQEARTLLEENLALQRQVGNRQRIATVLTGLGELARVQGNDAEARPFFEASLSMMQQVGDRWGSAMASSGLAMVDYEQGEFETARKRFEQSLALFQDMGNERAAAGILANLASVARSQGNLEQSRKLFRESLAKIWALQERSWAACTIEELGLLAAEQGDHSRAVILLGAAKVFMQETEYAQTPHDCARSDLAASEARMALGVEAFASAWAEGHAMTWEQAVTYALEKCEA